MISSWWLRLYVPTLAWLSLQLHLLHSFHCSIRIASWCWWIYARVAWYVFWYNAMCCLLGPILNLLWPWSFSYDTANYEAHVHYERRGNVLSRLTLNSLYVYRKSSVLCIQTRAMSATRRILFSDSADHLNCDLATCYICRSSGMVHDTSYFWSVNETHDHSI